MQTHFTKRILSIILTVVMVFSMSGRTVFAEGGVTIGTSGLTDCHTEHDETCGYIEALAAADCTHLNEDDSYFCAPEDADEYYICPRDDHCGYTEAVTGEDCEHTCDLCADTQMSLSFTSEQSEAITALMSAGDPVELNITGADNYVEITSTGYKVGGGATITYTGAYIITGNTTSTNAAWNHITVKGGTHNITLQDVSIG